MNFNEVFEILKLKFTSCNSTPVERTTLLRSEWNAILPALEQYASQPQNEGGLANAVRKAQVLAGEQAVIENLKRFGL